MHTAVLIARPGQLEPTLVEALRNAWGGGGITWLAAKEAAEFDMPGVPDTFRQTWSQLQDQSIDLNVIPTEGRKKKLLMADMDSTMIEQECIDEMAEVAGVGDAVRAVTAQAMNGELDFEEAVRARVAHYEGKPVSIIDTVLAKHISYASGGATLVATMKSNGAYTALVSGGFTQFTAAVADHLGFNENRANVLETEGEVLKGTVREPILGRDAKVLALEELTQRLGLSTQDVLAVGDGANDLGMLEEAGLGVAQHAKPSVAAACSVRINHGDLTALLYLQGYKRDEFVTP